MAPPSMTIVIELEGPARVRWSAPDESAHRRLVYDLAQRERPGVIIEVGVALRDALLDQLDRLREEPS